ncbi:hypothetical protein [Roseivirga sp.]|uniref:hypothetical protein n=1 Tax=Roseivirga sp. TaxID=1964215 RepID=UPI002B27503F|nr:hypothetical protein [Roseivirga sp.]
MKNLIFAFLILLISFSSCSEELDCCVIEIEESEQKWVLTEMTGSFSSTVFTGNDMDWQEYYLLNTNTGIFIKSRTTDGVETSASGTFIVNATEEEHTIELTYPSDSELIANCTGDLIEVLIIEENTLKGTWDPCDGPGLKYNRVQ